MEATTLVVVYSRDQELIDVLPQRLEQLDPRIEVHVVRAPGALHAHLSSGRANVVVVPAHDGEALAALSHLPATTPVVLLGDPTLSSAVPMPTRNPVEVVPAGAWDDLAASILRAVDSAARLAPAFVAEQLPLLFDTIPDGIFVEGSVLRYVNAAFCQNLGLSPRQVVGVSSLMDLAVPEDRGRLQLELTRVREASARREVIDVRLRTAEGRVARWEIACRSAVLGPERVVVGVARDVTAAVQLQEEIELARKRAAQVERLRALGELAAGVAHDFNNSLSTMLGRLRTVRDKIAQGQDANEDLRIIEQAGRDATLVVARIRDFSKPTGTDTWQEVDLSAVVKHAAEHVRTRVGNGIQLTVDTQETPRIQGNATELREVLVNLLTNALDAVATGGSVHVRCFGEEGRAVVVVQDNGHGMPESVQQRVFEPFFTTKAERGTGLGLSVSHWILRRHDAQIHLHSEPGAGTTFRLVFTPAVRSANTPTGLGPLSVLIVDDDATVGELMRELLQEAGHHVRLVQHPSEAAAALGQRRADLLITDLDLPGMSGWQLASRVREIQPEILVGVVTGWPMQESADALHKRGVDFVLAKPFSGESLLAAVAKAYSS